MSIYHVLITTSSPYKEIAKCESSAIESLLEGVAKSSFRSKGTSLQENNGLLGRAAVAAAAVTIGRGCAGGGGDNSRADNEGVAKSATDIAQYTVRVYTVLTCNI